MGSFSPAAAAQCLNTTHYSGLSLCGIFPAYAFNYVRLDHYIYWIDSNRSLKKDCCVSLPSQTKGENAFCRLKNLFSV